MQVGSQCVSFPVGVAESSICGADRQKHDPDQGMAEHGLSELDSPRQQDASRAHTEQGAVRVPDIHDT